jgi:hypothetical protein
MNGDAFLGRYPAQRSPVLDLTVQRMRRRPRLGNASPSHADLERRLRAYGRALEIPDPPDVTDKVVGRLRRRRSRFGAVRALAVAGLSKALAIARSFR